MAWHWTWQDPVALLLVALGLLLSFWLRARFAASGGCGAAPKAPPGVIPAQRLLRRVR